VAASRQSAANRSGNSNKVGARCGDARFGLLMLLPRKNTKGAEDFSLCVFCAFFAAIQRRCWGWFNDLSVNGGNGDKFSFAQIREIGG
jgi:hypothetical protein